MREDYTFEDVKEAALAGFSAGFEAAKELYNLPSTPVRQGPPGPPGPMGPPGEVVYSGGLAPMHPDSLSQYVPLKREASSPVDFFGGTAFRNPNTDEHGQEVRRTHKGSNKWPVRRTHKGSKDWPVIRVIQHHLRDARAYRNAIMRGKDAFPVPEDLPEAIATEVRTNFPCRIQGYEQWF